jgi:hypothetical protein
MPPGPVVGLGHVTQPNNLGPWRPEASGRDRKENRPDPEVDEGEGNAHFFRMRII